MPWLRQRVLMQHEKRDPQNKASKVKKFFQGRQDKKKKQ